MTFQNFDSPADRTFAKRHLPLLRTELTRQELDGFIIPHDDEYQNEYVPAYADRLMWVSGFTGSAGAAIVLADRAVIFVDGRYTLQVRAQTDGDFFAFADLVNTPVAQWLSANVGKDARIGFDPMLHSVDGAKRLRAAAEKANIKLVSVDENPVDAAWRDQPARPKSPVVPHPLEFAGISSEEKRASLASSLQELDADAFLMTAPASIAWTFNIRGQDVIRTPLTLARALINADGAATLFVDTDKLDGNVRAALGEGVRIESEEALLAALSAHGDAKKTIAIDPAQTPAKFADILKRAGARIHECADPSVLPRAIKNAAEIKGARDAHLRDGAALTQFLHWLDEEGPSGGVDEIAATQKLEALRAESSLLRDLSFDTISGAGPNGAIVHYRVTQDTNRLLKIGELFLVDSGAQYVDGTTDVTRTVPIGAPSEEMRDRFTRVLKGHIAIATARFPEGATGSQLDTLARMALWQAGLDYDHGTGHGVGSYLGVHEGPQGISKAARAAALKPGMIISNEPGYYKTDAYGIRIENLVLATPPTSLPGGDRPMLGFETLTLAPISLALVVPSLLTQQERAWLNAYHQRVRNALSALVPEATRDWLAAATRAI
ncbi:MAG: aminopeptidase P family protein [Pseudomonadota bacterium]